MPVLVYSADGGLLDDLQDPTVFTLNDPAVVKVLEEYARLFHEYELAHPSSVSWEVAYALVRADRIAMCLDPVSDATELRDLNWGRVAMPRFGPDPDQAVAGDIWTKGLAITTSSEHQALA